MAVCKPFTQLYNYNNHVHKLGLVVVHPVALPALGTLGIDTSFIPSFHFLPEAESETYCAPSAPTRRCVRRNQAEKAWTFTAVQLKCIILELLRNKNQRHKGGAFYSSLCRTCLFVLIHVLQSPPRLLLPLGHSLSLDEAGTATVHGALTAWRHAFFWTGPVDLCKVLILPNLEILIMAKPRAEVRNFGLRAEVGNMMVDYARQEDEFLAKTRQPKETRKPKVSGQITERGDQIATRIRDGTYQEGVLLAEHVAKPKEISRKHKMDLDQQQRELKKVDTFDRLRYAFHSNVNTG